MVAQKMRLWFEEDIPKELRNVKNVKPFGYNDRVGGLYRGELIKRIARAKTKEVKPVEVEANPG